MTTKTLENLFHDQLKDIYFAEKKILKTLPKMAKAAQSPKLKAAFEKHIVETEGQIERLEQVFEIFGKNHKQKPVKRLTVFLMKAQKSSKNTKIQLLLMLA